MVYKMEEGCVMVRKKEAFSVSLYDGCQFYREFLFSAVIVDLSRSMRTVHVAQNNDGNRCSLNRVTNGLGR